MELCNDVSLVGWKLLKTANKLLGHSQGEKTNGTVMKYNYHYIMRIFLIFKFIIKVFLIV